MTKTQWTGWESNKDLLSEIEEQWKLIKDIPFVDQVVVTHKDIVDKILKVLAWERKEVDYNFTGVEVFTTYLPDKYKDCIFIGPKKEMELFRNIMNSKYVTEELKIKWCELANNPDKKHGAGV